jgi:mono/diheme cytochrome c family protein
MPRAAIFTVAAVAAAVLSFAAAVGRPDGDREAAALDGASVFAAKGCATCHDGPGGQSLTDAGPTLAATPAWAGERIDGLTAEEYLEQSMRNPSAFNSPAYRAIGGPNDGMPVLQLSDEEIGALVAYLLAGEVDAIE